MQRVNAGQRMEDSVVEETPKIGTPKGISYTYRLRKHKKVLHFEVIRFCTSK